MPILDVLLKDPVGQFSLFVIIFSALIVVVLGIFFVVRSGKKPEDKK